MNWTGKKMAVEADKLYAWGFTFLSRRQPAFNSRLQTVQ